LRRPAGAGPRRISGHGGRKRSLSDHLRRAAGDALIANGKHRRKKIFQLEQDEETIIGQENLKNYITDYYKSLFGPPISNTCVMDKSRTNDIPKISVEENNILTAEISESEVF
jgi:hypothetical protein